MKRSLQKIVLVGVGNVFNAVLGFAFLSVAARVLDLESFGKYAMLATVLVAVSKLIDFGTNSVYVAKSISTEDKSLTDTFYTLKIILLLISVPVSLVILLALKLNDTTLIVCFILGLLAYAINYTLNTFFQKMEKFIHLVALNTLPALIKGIFAFLIFSNLVNFGLDQIFGVFSLSIFSSSFLIIFLPKEYKTFKIDFSKAKKIIKEATPAGISQLIYEGWPSIANAIAKVAKDFSNVGIFSIAEKLAGVLSLASLSVFTVLLPKNARRKKEHGKYDFKEIAAISVLILIVAFLGIFVSEFFIIKFFGEKFTESIPLLGILIFASAFTAIHTFMEHYFFIEEKTNYIMYVNIGKLGVFLGLAFILVPTMSLQGLAISNLVAAITALLATAVLVKKNEDIHFT